MLKVLTLVYLVLVCPSSYASSKKSNKTFKQLKQDMLVHGLDFNYITSTVKSPFNNEQLKEVESLRPEPGVYPEEINAILKKL